MERTKSSILALIAILTTANALWMILAPFHWYQHVPAEVPDFGPYNQHFVRDFGCAFLLVGCGLIGGLKITKYKPASILFALGFYGLHAATHIYDTLTGAVHHTHWLVDFPTTYLPALLLAWIANDELRSK